MEVLDDGDQPQLVSGQSSRKFKPRHGWRPLQSESNRPRRSWSAHASVAEATKSLEEAQADLHEGEAQLVRLSQEPGVCQPMPERPTSASSAELDRLGRLVEELSAVNSQHRRVSHRSLSVRPFRGSCRGGQRESRVGIIAQRTRRSEEFVGGRLRSRRSLQEAGKKVGRHLRLGSDAIQASGKFVHWHRHEHGFGTDASCGSFIDNGVPHQHPCWRTSHIRHNPLPFAMSWRRLVLEVGETQRSSRCGVREQ